MPLANLNTVELGNGGFIVVLTRSGSAPIPALFYGYTGNVGVLRRHTLHRVLNIHF